MAPKLRAILFDVDGVLLDSTAAVAAFYRELYFRITGASLAEKDLTGFRHRSMADMLHRFFPEKSHDEIRELVKFGDTIDTGFDLLRLSIGAEQVVPSLAKRFSLGLVTNRTREGIEELWKLSGFQQYFSSSAAYEDTEKHKPDPEPLRFALMQLGINPTEAIFIGDAKTDLEAGMAAGVKVVILGSEQWPGASATITSLLELENVITTLA